VALLVALTTMLPQFGCSFIFLDRPREYGRFEKVDCTTSYALPALDAGLAALHLVSLAILASASGNEYGGEKTREAFARGDVLWLTIHAVSSGWGFYKVGECKDLVADGGGPVRPTPRPRPRPIAGPGAASSPPPVPAEAAPAPAAPAPAPVPATPPVQQKADDE
jgi:hypothetical protein